MNGQSQILTPQERRQILTSILTDCGVLDYCSEIQRGSRTVRRVAVDMVIRDANYFCSQEEQDMMVYKSDVRCARNKLRHTSLARPAMSRTPMHVIASYPFGSLAAAISGSRAVHAVVPGT